MCRPSVVAAGEGGLLSSAQSSHYGGFSCCRAQALGYPGATLQAGPGEPWQRQGVERQRWPRRETPLAPWPAHKRQLTS